MIFQVELTSKNVECVLPTTVMTFTFGEYLQSFINFKTMIASEETLLNEKPSQIFFRK